MKIRIVEVQDADLPELAVYNTLNEAQLRHYYEPVKEGLFIAESPVVIERALAAGFEPVSLYIDPRYLPAPDGSFFGVKAETAGGAADESGDTVPVYTAPRSLMQQTAGYKVTLGAMCAMRRKPAADLMQILETAERIVVLENVMNPTNCGAIFRSAAALGMDAVLLTAGSGDPLYRRSIRVSMGTVFTMPWAYLPAAVPVRAEAGDDAGTDTGGMEEEKNPGGAGGRQSAADSVKLLQQKGFTCAAMALRSDSVPPDDPVFADREKIAVFMGTEEAGLNAETIEACDQTVMIPMARNVDSLNVSVAAGIAFWNFGKRG